MRIKLDGKVYELEAITKLTLADILRFNREATAGAWGITWEDLESQLPAIAALPEQERKQHPLFYWYFGVTIWRAMKDAGETLTFESAFDRIPMLDSDRLEIVAEPQDRKPPTKGPRKPRPTPKGSGRG